MRGPPLLLTLFGAVLVAAGCGTAESAPPASPFPPRPESIDVSRLDPCSGVTPAEADRLGIDSGSPSTATVNGVRSPACTWVGVDGDSYNYGAQTISFDAADAIREAGSSIIEVDGFGAVRGAPATNNGPGLPAFCQLAVDVADGQTLRIQVDNSDPATDEDPAVIDEVCAEAHRFTSRFLSTIQG